MKIIGVPATTPLPKPNFDQKDPTKGDYIHGNRSFMDAVTFTEQTLTDEQKAQARANIDAVAVTLVATDPNGDGRIVFEYDGNISGEVLPTAEGVNF